MRGQWMPGWLILLWILAGTWFFLPRPAPWAPVRPVPVAPLAPPNPGSPLHAQLEQPAPRFRAPWSRLIQARDVVGRLLAQGWIYPHGTRGLPQSIQRLQGLAVAAGMTDHLGGRRSDTVERQIVQLCDLLIALADEAVELQAAAGSTDFTPATLAAAAERLAADRAAYAELMTLGGAHPGPVA